MMKQFSWKRLIGAVLCLALLWSFCLPALAAKDTDEEKLTEEEEKETEELDAVDESIYAFEGNKLEERTREEFSKDSPALYTATLRTGYSIFSEKTVKSKRLFKPTKEVKVDILYVGLVWLIVRYDKYIGYSKREWFRFNYDIRVMFEATDPANTAPLNVQKHQYLATAATTVHVRKTMDKAPEGDGDDGNNWVILNPGTRFTIWKFYEGWAVVNYMRSYGYVDPNELKDLIPVSPTDEELYPDSPIAAYTSYYKLTKSESNISRIHNIRIGCGYVSQTLEPGQEFDANKVMGPYNPRKGYEKAPVLIEGSAVPGYGGGTCQVSSTLYNVLIQLPKIEITQRRPHGAGGASYLPIHCDAAVGNEYLNLRFVNQYDFPIRIVGESQDDGALLMLIYRAH